MPKHPTHKECPRCRLRKPRTDLFWYKRTGAPDGLQSYCKECTKRANSARHRQAKHHEGKLALIQSYAEKALTEPDHILGCLLAILELTNKETKCPD